MTRRTLGFVAAVTLLQLLLANAASATCLVKIGGKWEYSAGWCSDWNAYAQANPGFACFNGPPTVAGPGHGSAAHGTLERYSATDVLFVTPSGRRLSLASDSMQRILDGIVRRALAARPVGRITVPSDHGIISNWRLIQLSREMGAAIVTHSGGQPRPVAFPEADAGSRDPMLNVDTRYAPSSAHAENGTGTDAGTYLPPLAGPQSEVVGTVISDSGSGPTDFYIAAVDDRGTSYYWKGTTERNGHFHLRVPQIYLAGHRYWPIARLLLFKHFDRHGRPDTGAASYIGATAQIQDAQPVANAPLSGPAIVEASTSYERGGAGQGFVQLLTRGIDPLRAQVLLDGSDRAIDTLAACDESIVARFHDSVALGRHSIVVQSDGRRTNVQIADIVAEQIAPIGVLHSGQVVPVHLTIDGLGDDPAQATFTVTGAASLADGKASDTIPVQSGAATAEIRAGHPGQLLVHVDLEVFFRGIPPNCRPHSSHMAVKSSGYGSEIHCGGYHPRRTPKPGEPYPKSMAQRHKRTPEDP